MKRLVIPVALLVTLVSAFSSFTFGVENAMASSVPSIARLAAASSATVFAQTSYGSPSNSTEENGSWWYRDGYPYPGGQNGWGFSNDKSVGEYHPGNCPAGDDFEGICFRSGDANSTTRQQAIKVRFWCTWDGSGTYDKSQRSGTYYQCMNNGFYLEDRTCVRENWCPAYWYKLVDSFTESWVGGEDNFIQAGGTIGGAETQLAYRAFFSSDSPTYFPFGPQKDVPLERIYRGGWSLCWVGQYSDQRTSITEIQSSCDKKFVIMSASYIDPHILEMEPRTIMTEGTYKVGQKILIDTRDWSPDSQFQIQWLRDGNPIPNETGITYTLTSEDYLHDISVSVSVSKPGYLSTTFRSVGNHVGEGDLISVSEPTISGMNSVGSTLTANPGFWGSSVSFSFRWLRDGNWIPLATSQHYVLSSEDYLHAITVDVTGFSKGFNPVTKTSQPISVGPGALSGLTKPTVFGDGSLNSTLLASSTNSNYRVSYQWERDGLVSGVSGPNYNVELKDLGSLLKVNATYSRFGYQDSVVASGDIQISTIVPNTACSAKVDGSSWLGSSSLQPTVKGSGLFGSMLQGSNGSWSSGTRFCTYWYENGKAIAGAFGSSYKIQPSDIGQQIQYVVVGTDKAGKTALRYSNPITIGNSKFTSVKVPVISGQVRVGSKLLGIAKPWNSAVNYTYQWLRNGSPIFEATLSSYVLSTADLGSSISLKVCGSKEYFDTMCLNSGSTAVVGLGVISSKPAPTISGNSTKAGSTLTGSTGNWISGVQLQAQWLSDGDPIPGATATSYVIQNSDKGRTLRFQVTASADGYQTVVKVSAGKKIP